MELARRTEGFGHTCGPGEILALAQLLYGHRPHAWLVTLPTCAMEHSQELSATARAGVDNMTKTLAVEWAQHGVAVNAIAPGIIRSTGTDRYPPELLEMARTRTPMKRLGTSEEVAELCAYLASDAAHFVTGVTWYIDGGAHLWGDTWVIPDREEPAPPEVVQKLPR